LPQSRLRTAIFLDLITSPCSCSLLLARFLDWANPRPRGGLILGKPRAHASRSSRGLVYLFASPQIWMNRVFTFPRLRLSGGAGCDRGRLTGGGSWDRVAFCSDCLRDGRRAALATAWVVWKARAACKPPCCSQARRHRARPVLDPRVGSLSRLPLVSATPFVAAAYGLLYGRLDVEVVRQRSTWRAAKVFEGFRIGPALRHSHRSLHHFGLHSSLRHDTNGLNPVLVVLPGDYICWNPHAEGEAVHALAASARAPTAFRRFGNQRRRAKSKSPSPPCLRRRAIRILRQERAIRLSAAKQLNLIGWTSHKVKMGRDVYRRCSRSKASVPELSTFCCFITAVFRLRHGTRAFIDLTLAGHTHRRQLSLDFVHRGSTSAVW